MDNTTGVNVNELNKLDVNTNQLPDLTNKSGSEIMAAMWGLSNTGVIQQITNINKVYGSRHGMFASVPIVCRADDCAFASVCMVDQSQRIKGIRCPMEISAIISRYEQWCNHFDISLKQDEIDPKDLVDATLIKDLVNIEVQMIRAENKIAINGDFMADTLLDIDKKCNPYYGKIVSAEEEFLMTLQDKKIKLLNQLNATRKDKAADKRKESASDEAIRIFQQIKEMQSNENQNVTDIEFDDEGNIVVDETVEEANIHQMIQPGGDENGNGEESVGGTNDSE